MPMPHLHILHPPECRFPGITQWIAEVEQILRRDEKWEGCVFRRAVYDEQARFNVPTQVDLVRRSPGPVILVQKVQGATREQFERILQRRVSTYCITPTCAEDIWQACETARQAYEDGEPRVPLREVIAFLILRKLERQGKWGGESLNKSFLWSENLPKGGFPKDLVCPSEVLDVAEQLARLGILNVKKSQGQRKYALGPKSVVQPILDAKSFEIQPCIRKFFERNPKRVMASLLDYNES